MSSLRSLDIHELEYAEQYRYSGGNVSPPDIYGIDTETYEGYARCLCDSFGRFLFCDEESPIEVAEWLMYRPYRNATGLAWNMEFDATAIIKHFPEWVIEEAYHFTEVEYEAENGQTYGIKWIPGKAFSISNGKHTTKLFDAMQFFYMPLDKASETILGENKGDVAYEDLEDPEYWENHRKEIRKYCIRDAELTAELGEMLGKVFTDLGVSFDTPYSTGYLASRFFVSNTEMPVFNKFEWHQYAMRAYYAGRFEVVRRGRFPEAYYYDINSAFPAVMAELPDFTRGEWIEGSEISSESEVGFARCTVTTDCDYVSPIVRSERNTNIYPNVTNETVYLEQKEIEYIRDMADAWVDIENGYWFVPSDDEKPFSVIRELYKDRNEKKAKMKAAKERDDSEGFSEWFVKQKAVKILMNSVYGKTVEMKEGYKPTEDRSEAVLSWDKPDADTDLWRKSYTPGQLFYPVIGSAITARVRVQLYDAMRKAGDSLIAAFADCIVVDEPCIEKSEGLGGWDLDVEGELMMVKSGVYTFRKPNGDVKTAFRGFKFDDSLDLISVFGSNPLAERLERPSGERPRTVGEMVSARESVTKENLNAFEEMQDVLKLNTGIKREWEDEPGVLGDMLDGVYDSSPRVV